MHRWYWFQSPNSGQQGTTTCPRVFQMIQLQQVFSRWSVAQALGASPLEPETSTQYTWDSCYQAIGLRHGGRPPSTWTTDSIQYRLSPCQLIQFWCCTANFKLLAAGCWCELHRRVFWFTNAFEFFFRVDVVATMPFDFDNSSGS